MTRKQHLKTAGISRKTLGIYRREVSLFFRFLDLEGFGLPRSYVRLDQLLAEYINHLFQEGDSLTKAGWVLSGIKRLYPRVRRELAISQQWYNNWCREHTPRRATPITWPLIQAFTGLCLHLKWVRLATLFLLSFVFSSGLERCWLCGAVISFATWMTAQSSYDWLRRRPLLLPSKVWLILTCGCPSCCAGYFFILARTKFCGLFQGRIFANASLQFALSLSCSTCSWFRTASEEEGLPTFIPRRTGLMPS